MAWACLQPCSAPRPEGSMGGGRPAQARPPGPDGGGQAGAVTQGLRCGTMQERRGSPRRPGWDKEGAGQAPVTVEAVSQGGWRPDVKSGAGRPGPLSAHSLASGTGPRRLGWSFLLFRAWAFYGRCEKPGSMLWEGFPVPGRAGAGGDPQRVLTVRVQGALRECWGKWAPCPAGEGWTGQCLGAWLSMAERSRVLFPDVRNVTRLVCFPSLTKQASHLVDQPAGHTQGGL